MPQSLPCFIHIPDPVGPMVKVKAGLNPTKLNHYLQTVVALRALHLTSLNSSGDLGLRSFQPPKPVLVWYTITEWCSDIHCSAEPANSNQQLLPTHNEATLCCLLAAHYQFCFYLFWSSSWLTWPCLWLTPVLSNYLTPFLRGHRNGAKTLAGS